MGRSMPSSPPIRSGRPFATDFESEAFRLVRGNRSVLIFLELRDEALRDTQRIAAHLEGFGRTETSGLPVIDAALALGRVTALTGKDEVIWIRACLTAESAR